METADLDECDFLVCEIKELSSKRRISWNRIPNETNYLNGVNNINV
jgi:hypothetical protein